MDEIHGTRTRFTAVVSVQGESVLTQPPAILFTVSASLVHETFINGHRLPYRGARYLTYVSGCWLPVVG